MEQNNKSNWLLWGLLIFLPPFGILYMWIAKKELSQKKKKTLSVVFSIWFLFCMIIGESQGTQNDLPVERDNSITTDSNNGIENEHSTANDTPQSAVSNYKSQENINTSENVSVETDLEIITRSGHPTYYGSVASSHIIWDDVPKNKIIFGDKNESFGNETILSMEAYRNSDLIRCINVHFSNFEEPPCLTIEDVLSIVSSYMPYDIIAQYYHYKGSELLVPDDDNHLKHEKYYILSYGLTEEGSEAYYKGTHEYSGSIDVIITTDENDIVNNFYINFGTPRWMSSLTLNSYHKEIWECDLTNYIESSEK